MASVASMKIMALWRDSQQLMVLIEQTVRHYPRYHKYTLATELRRQHIAYCLILQAGYLMVDLKQRLLVALFTPLTLLSLLHEDALC